MPFPIGGPLGPRLYLQPFARYSTPNTRARAHTHTHTDTDTSDFYILFNAAYFTGQTITRTIKNYECVIMPVKKTVKSKQMSKNAPKSTFSQNRRVN